LTNNTLKIRSSKVDKTEGTEFLDIPITKTITFAELIHNTLENMGTNKFFSYDGRKNNCQDFMIALLQSNGLLTNQSAEFIKRDVDFIFKNSSLRSF
jgi:hypothetical protein